MTPRSGLPGVLNGHHGSQREPRRVGVRSVVGKSEGAGRHRGPNEARPVLETCLEELLDLQLAQVTALLGEAGAAHTLVSRSTGGRF